MKSTTDTSGDDTVSSSSACLDDSLLLPAIVNDPETNDETDNTSSCSADGNEACKELISCQCKYNVKMMAIILMDIS